MLIGWDNKADAGTVTAGAQISTLPASNVQESRLSRQWRTPTGVKRSRLLVDLGSAISADLLGAFGTNLTDAARMRVRASYYDAAAHAGDAIDTGLISAGVEPPFTAIYKAVKASYLTLDADKVPAFYIDYTQGNLYPLIGAVAPTFTRATAATVTDFEGIIRDVKSGEARFQGLRRIENLVATKSEDFSNAAWTKSNVTVASTNELTATNTNGTCLQALTRAAADYRLRVKLRRKTGSGNIQLTIDGSTYTTVALTTDDKTFSITQAAVTNPNFGIRIATNTDAIYAAEIQLEDVTWQANTNPAEYVSVGVIASAPYHGCNVDGVKYVPWENGNTVASNVVTETRGAAIAEATAEGYLHEGARTNAIRNNSMTGAAAGTPGTRPTGWAAWAISGLTQEIVAVGRADGLDYIDVRLSGTTAGTQAILWFDSTTGIASVQNDVWCHTFWLSLVGGALTNITGWNSIIGERDGGGASLTTTLTAVSAPTATLTRQSAAHTIGNASAAFALPGLQFTFANGVAIDATIRIASPQIELAASPSSLIRTTSAAATRNNDQLSYSATSWANAAEGALVAWYRYPIAGFGGVRRVASLVTDVNNLMRIGVNTDGSADAALVTAGGATQANISLGAVVANTDYRTAFGYKADDFAASRNGGAVVTDASGTVPAVTTLQIGNSLGSASPMFGTIRRVACYAERLPDATLQAEPVTAELTVAARYWRIDLEDLTLADNLHVGRLFLGPSWEPSAPYDWGGGVGYVDPSEKLEADGGQTFWHERPRRKLRMFKLSWMTEAEAMENALAIAYENGIVHDVLVFDEGVTYPSHKSIWGEIQVSEPVYQRRLDTYEQKFSILETL